jgi:hypothetical protein
LAPRDILLHRESLPRPGSSGRAIFLSSVSDILGSNSGPNEKPTPNSDKVGPGHTLKGLGPGRVSHNEPPVPPRRLESPNSRVCNSLYRSCDFHARYPLMCGGIIYN